MVLLESADNNNDKNLKFPFNKTQAVKPGVSLPKNARHNRRSIKYQKRKSKKAKKQKRKKQKEKREKKRRWRRRRRRMRRMRRIFRAAFHFSSLPP
jgi:hypothetical protein